MTIFESSYTSDIRKTFFFSHTDFAFRQPRSLQQQELELLQYMVWSPPFWDPAASFEIWAIQDLRPPGDAVAQWRLDAFPNSYVNWKLDLTTLLSFNVVFPLVRTV